MTGPVRVAIDTHEKVWGSEVTEPWLRNPSGQKIGEIWFRTSEQFPLLTKLLFTSDRLSVQVHPNDSYAAQFDSKGKTEMWHVLHAEPEARVALGLREPVSPEEFEAACRSGAVVDMLNWFPAQAGDTFFTPAGTVHAIGGGLTICEIQQFSDITYRLFDYNREGRDLHLDHGIRVSHLTSHPGAGTAVVLTESHQLLAECEYFRTERLEISGEVLCPGPLRDTLYVATEGQGIIAGEPFRQGEAFEVPAGSAPFEISSSRAVFLITSEPS